MTIKSVLESLEDQYGTVVIFDDIAVMTINEVEVRHTENSSKYEPVRFSYSITDMI